MLLSLLAADQIVVGKGEAEGQVPEVLVYQALEGLACITQSEGHEIILKQAKGSDYSGFRFILLFDRYLMVALDQVKLTEDGGAVD